MDWTQIVILVLGGTTIGSVVSAIAYRRQNKRLKENEVKKDDVATQKEQMDLGEEYLRKVMDLSEMNYQQSVKNGTDNAAIMQKIDAVAEEQKHIVAYLNGEYQSFLVKNGFKA